MNHTTNREELRYGKSFNIAVGDRQPHTSFPEHWHLSAEFILVRADNCEYTVNGIEYHLNSGDILLVWPTELHSIVSAPQNSATLLQFNSDLISTCSDISLFYRNMRSLHLIKKEETDLSVDVTQRIEEIHRLLKSEDEFAATRARIQLYEMLILLAQGTRSRKITDENARANVSATETFLKIKSACNYIVENCERNLSQTDVAEYAGFSPYYFSRIFKKYTGEGFSEFLTRHRIEKAIQMLCSENIPITEIGFYAGFQSVSNFNRAFKNSMNCSPKEFRRMHVSSRAQ